MTNYRLNMCARHDKPQFNFCFDCGAPLDKGRTDAQGDTYFSCSREPIHLKIWPYPHADDETDCPVSLEWA